MSKKRTGRSVLSSSSPKVWVLALSASVTEEPVFRSKR
jgi:hypothetical protein